jgi:hypothetical protein
LLMFQTGFGRQPTDGQPGSSYLSSLPIPPGVRHARSMSELSADERSYAHAVCPVRHAPPT